MNVYVETNFLIEIAFEQEGSPACDEILKLAEAKDVGLLVPAYCFGECYEKAGRNRIARAALSRQVSADIKELTRSSHFRHRKEELEELAKILLSGAPYESRRLGETFERVLSAAEVIPLTAEILSAAARDGDKLGLGPQDALVYFSVLARLKAAPSGGSCFLNRNVKDFGQPHIIREVESYGGKLLFNFEAGLSYIRHAQR